MSYRFLADAVVILHLILGVFAVLGGLLVFLWYRIIWLHIPVALVVAFVELTGSFCPFTLLENWLRVQGGEAAYSGGFVQHYISPVLYPPGITRGTLLCHGVVVLGINLLIYWQIFRRRHEGFR